MPDKSKNLYKMPVAETAWLCPKCINSFVTKKISPINLEATVWCLIVKEIGTQDITACSHFSETGDKTKVKICEESR